MKSKFNFLLLALLIQGIAARPVCGGAAGKERPNVLFILADDLGYGDLGCYGAVKTRTPNIDRLAKEGLRFTDAHSPSSVCTPSRYNLLTGRYAWRTWNGGGTVWANDPCLIEEGRHTLADLFKEQGYQTAMLGKWHLGFGKPGMEGWDDILGPDYNRDLKPGPLEFGFDYFWGFPHVGQFPHFIIENHRVLGLDPKDPIRITPDPRPGYELDYLHRPRLGGAARLGQAGGEATRYQHEELSDMLTARAVKWLDDCEQEKPFFLYLAHRNIHGPLKPASRFKGSSEIGVYGDFLNEFDESIGKVLDARDRNGLTGNTLVLFSSDNGGIFQYRPIDHPEIKGHRINGPLRGQKTSVYEGGVRVPLLARWPGRIEPGSVDNKSLIALTDVLATFADHFGKTLPENAGEDSFSFLEALTGREQSTPMRESLVMDSFINRMAIRRGPWKLIFGQNGGGARADDTVDPAKPAGLLYNLADDLGEATNRYTGNRRVVNQLTREYERFRRRGRSR